MGISQMCLYIWGYFPVFIFTSSLAIPALTGQTEERATAENGKT